MSRPSAKDRSAGTVWSARTCSLVDGAFGGAVAVGQGECGGDGVVVDEQAFGEGPQRGHRLVGADLLDPGVQPCGVLVQVAVVVGGEQGGEGAYVAGGGLEFGAVFEGVFQPGLPGGGEFRRVGGDPAGEAAGRGRRVLAVGAALAEVAVEQGGAALVAHCLDLAKQGPGGHGGLLGAALPQVVAERVDQGGGVFRSVDQLPGVLGGGVLLDGVARQVQPAHDLPV